MSIYPAWFRAIRAAIKPFFKKLDVQGAENIKEPCVIIARHLNNYGPMAVYLFTPAEFHLWAYHVFLDKDTFYKQFSEYTFPKRTRMPGWLCRALARLLSSFAPGLLRKIGILPVYRGMKDVLKTMDMSVDALEKGENVLILPDVDYVSQSENVGKLYTGFVHLGKFYYRRTGKRLLFVPMCINKCKGTMRIGEGVAFDPDKPLADERERIAAYLQKELEG
ncbi:MAG: lysophospholipid acyltransferase family protein [Candidatus Spyradocola sp.]